MANPESPPNPDLFNRVPRRQAFDFIIDSANRDLERFPESNDFEIELPMCPKKNVRNVNVLAMMVPMTEPTIYVPAIKPNISKSGLRYDHANNVLFFNEGITISEGANVVRFQIGGVRENIQVHLPLTVQPICPCGITLIGDCLRVVTPMPHNYLEGEQVLLVGYPFVPDCPTLQPTDIDPNGEYVVKKVAGPDTVFLRPLDNRFSEGDPCEGLTVGSGTLPPLECGDRPFLVIEPLEDQNALAELVETYLNSAFQYREINFTVFFNPTTGEYTIEDSLGGRYSAPTLLGPGNENAFALLKPGTYTEEELAQVISEALNQPTVVEDVNDRFFFRDLGQPETEVILKPGTYTPEQLALAIAEGLNLSAINGYSGCYDAALGVFCFTADTVPFDLLLERSPEFAKLIGFYAIDHVAEMQYCSQCPVFYARYKTELAKGLPRRTKNKYTVKWDPKKQQFGVFRSGQVSANVLTVTALNNGCSEIVTEGPHALEPWDIVLVQQLPKPPCTDSCPPADPLPFAPGVYVVTCVNGPCSVTIDMKVCPEIVGAMDGEPIPVENTTIGSIPLPFNLDFGTDRSSLAQVLGFEDATLTGQSYYTSSKNCFEFCPLYLLLSIPELNQRLYAQFKHDGPDQLFFVRLDRDLDDKSFALTHVPEACEDLIVGKTYNLSKLTIRLFKPNGSLYDTRRCNFSIYMRLVVER